MLHSNDKETNEYLYIDFTIELSNAVIQPKTMMVHAVDTNIAPAAMIISRRFNSFAYLAFVYILLMQWLIEEIIRKC